MEAYQLRFGIDISGKVVALVSNGLVEIQNGQLRLTRRGMLFSNEVFAEFV
jgi:coproporphyrinogen III oxidase-like Fe-S oxidoreductase